MRRTLGTSMLWVEGEMSSSFLPVKIWSVSGHPKEVIGRLNRVCAGSAELSDSSTHVDGDKVDLGVTVLAGLRGGHVDDLAGTAWRSAYAPASSRASSCWKPATAANSAHP